MTALEVSRDGYVWRATMTGSGPNAVDERLLADLTALVDEVEADDRVRVVVLTGSDGTFCVGVDLSVLERGFAEHDYLVDMLTRFHHQLARMERLPVTLLAAVNGTARAGGLELLLACDLVVVADEARIADHHLHSGILPGGGASARLPRRIGEQRARELLLTARWLSGPEAVAYGLALRSVPRNELSDLVDDTVARLADKPRHAVGALKGLLAAGSGCGVDEACELELEHFARFLAEQPLAGEGYQAYVEGREPRWRSE